MNAVAPSSSMYAPEGSINVRLQATAQGLRLTVDDHGPGIPVAQRERILEPFHRLEINRAQPGTGVGLAVVAEFIRLQRGELRVEDRPGGGARFVVLLPSSAAA